MKQRIGFAGLGLMGSGMARRLVDQGHDLVVWNRSADKAAPLAEAGARVVKTPGDLGECPVIVSMLTGDEAVRDVYLGPTGIGQTITEGAIAIEMSTTSIASKLDLADALKQRGAAFLDAPVFGSTQPAAAGELVTVVGGDDDILERARPVLEAMTRAIFHLGPVGAGSAMKLSGNLVGAGSTALLSEALNLGQAAGLEGSRMLEVFGAISLNSPMLQSRGAAALAGSFEPGWPVKHVLKDVSLAIEAGRAHGLKLNALEGARSVYEAAVDAGLGDEDCIAVYKAITTGQ